MIQDTKYRWLSSRFRDSITNALELPIYHNNGKDWYFQFDYDNNMSYIYSLSIP